RWDLPLPDRDATLRYMRDVLDRALDAARDEHRYFYELSLFHEDMHGEALTYTRQTLGYPALPGEPPAPTGRWPGDVEIPGGELMLGGRDDGTCVSDNEKWAHPVRVEPFAIARAPVTNAEFARFVDDGGYARDEWWSDAGRRWREATCATAPVYWERDGG